MKRASDHATGLLARALLYAVLVLGSVPILIPYLWLFTV